MGGDYSRRRYAPEKGVAYNLWQQGRVTLDADLNELAEAIDRRIRAGTVDTIGRAVVPRETPAGFRIALTDDGLRIGRGVIYVDGIRAENKGPARDGDPPWRLDALDDAPPTPGRSAGVLRELIGGPWLAFEQQPHAPSFANFPDGDPSPSASDQPYLVYLDVWRRAVTPLIDPDLLEPALGGPDTVTQMRTTWRVRILPGVGDVTCATPEDQIPGWRQATDASAGRLTSDTVDADAVEDPCLTPPGGGYRGLENQNYWVEIQFPNGFTGEGPFGGAHFKWSRESRSVAARVVAVSADGTRLTLDTLGRDAKLSFEREGWIEVTDEVRDLDARPGVMRKIADIEPDTNTIVLQGALAASDQLTPAAAVDNQAAWLAERRVRVIRWDQRGVVNRIVAGARQPHADVDATGGLIPLPPPGVAVELEHGLTVSFSLAPEGGRMRDQDYWMIAARAADGSAETRTQAPPDGIHHHYARLAVVTANADRGAGGDLDEDGDGVFDSTPSDDSGVLDCREFWPPAPPSVQPGGDCSCNICVTPDQHNSGALTLQAAVDQVLDAGGGVVCLDRGVYQLGAAPLVVREEGPNDGRGHVIIRGRGYASVIEAVDAPSAVWLQGAGPVTIEHLSVRNTVAQSRQAMFNVVLLDDARDVVIRDCAVFGRLRAEQDDDGPNGRDEIADTPQPAARGAGGLDMRAFTDVAAGFENAVRAGTMRERAARPAAEEVIVVRGSSAFRDGGAAIGARGRLQRVLIERCALRGLYGVGGELVQGNDGAQGVALRGVEVSRNWIRGSAAGVYFVNRVDVREDLRVAQNMIEADQSAGVVVVGAQASPRDIDTFVALAQIDVADNLIVADAGVVVGPWPARIRGNDIFGPRFDTIDAAPPGLGDYGMPRGWSGLAGVELLTNSSDPVVLDIQVTENRVRGMTGPGVRVRRFAAVDGRERGLAVRSLNVCDNDIRGVIQCGVVVEQPSGDRVVEDDRAFDFHKALTIARNHIIDVRALQSIQEPGAGVRVVNANNVDIAQNIIQRAGRIDQGVGSPDEVTAVSGVDVEASTAGRIVGNQIEAIGSPYREMNGYGVRIRGAFERFEISGNHIERGPRRRDSGLQDQNFRAIQVRVEASGDEQERGDIPVNADPVTGEPFAALPARLARGDGETTQLLAHGNVIRAGSPLEDEPMVDILGLWDGAWACTFSDNLVDVIGDYPAKAAVRIRASWIIATGNMVRMTSPDPSQPAAMLLLPSDAKLTVREGGNLTTAKIQIS